jgi:molybdopterin molybdotransferase
MVEHTQDLTGGGIEIAKSLAPNENVILRGEDARTGAEILPAGTALRAQELGLLAALGETRPMVHRAPRVAILSTGDELVDVDATPALGQIRDVNSATLAALVCDAGAEPVPLGLVADELDDLLAALKRGLAEADVVFLSGGSSVGVRDLTAEAVIKLGGQLLAHGVQMSPGKPTLLAEVEGKAVIGLPGQVTSALVVMLVFGQPFLRHLAGDPGAFDVSRRPLIQAELARNVASRQGREDYLRVSLEPRSDAPPLAWPRLGKSGLLRTLVEAEGLVIIDARLEGLNQGQAVDVWRI